MSRSPWPILYEDNHLLVVVKPAMLPTMGVAQDRPSLLSQAKTYIKQAYNKPGNVYLGIVSRLDAPVTGVLVLARTSKAAARLTEQFRSGSVTKTYLAAVSGQIAPATGSLRNFVRKDERHRRMHVVDAESSLAKEARLRYQTVRQLPNICVVEVELETGRKHQIRVQLAHAGHPILGDRKYGSRLVFDKGIALHAYRLKFQHPVRRESLDFTAPLPGAWKGINYQP